MKLYLAKPGGPMEGPYTLEQINADIAAKKYKDSDYWAWYQGLTAWVPLYAVGGVCAATDTTLFFARPASAENPAPSHPPQPPASDTAFFLAAHAPGGAQGAGQLEACTPTPVVAAASKAAYSDPASEVCPFSDASTAGAEEVYANLENLEGNMDVALPEDGRTPAELSECAAPEAGGREPVAQVPAPEPTALAAIEPAPDPAQTANSSIADVSPAAPADPGNAEAPAPAESVAIQAALEIVNGAAHEPAGEQPQAQQPAAASPRKRRSLSQKRRVAAKRTSPALGSSLDAGPRTAKSSRLRRGRKSLAKSESSGSSLSPLAG